MTFGKEFTKAVEQKQIAQQDAERARFIVEKAEQERQANVIRAEGEAESADIISKAVAKAGDGLIMIRRIEASREIAQTLAGKYVYVLSSILCMMLILVTLARTLLTYLEEERVEERMARAERRYSWGSGRRVMKVMGA